VAEEPTDPGNLIAATLDLDGRKVTMTGPAWAHVKADHPEITRRLRDVMAAVREPDLRMPGRVIGEEWLFAENIGPSRWLQVVVHYEGGEGWVITAFARSSLPRR
jgi:hypothetical protein